MDIVERLTAFNSTRTDRSTKRSTVYSPMMTPLYLTVISMLLLDRKAG
jgi:hypothetical protein